MANRGELFLVVMAGGSGTRFWPKSTSKRPKQFLSFEADPQATLLGRTVSRFDGLIAEDKRYVATTRALSPLVEKMGGGLKILAEPQGRNTAPCVYWAARAIAERNPEGVMLVMPSDHYIAQLPAFRETVKMAANWAATHDDLVTLGVKPSRPETGYGYLRLGQALSGVTGGNQVQAFVEKPNSEKAQEFVSSGNYLWNGGMFLWRASVILSEFDRLMPELRKAWEESGGDIERAYPKMTATSIDYGVMEKAKSVVTFTLDCGWDDLGSWTSLESLAQAIGAVRTEGTVTGGELLAVQSKGHIVDAPGKLVAILGVDDLIVAESGEAILICPKDRAQDIRLVVEAVKKARPGLA